MMTTTKTWTGEDVEEMFTTGVTGLRRGMWEEYDELAEYLNRGWITFQALTYCPTPPPSSENPASPEHAAYLAAFKKGTGGEKHSLLKWSAWNWLRNQGEPNPEFEQWTAHGRADVVAPRLNWLVECGDTSPCNVFQAFEAKACDVFALFPFASGSEYPLWLLRVTPAGHAALQARSRERQRRMREAINRL